MHRVLVVGGGSIGERHVRCFLKTGRAEVSLCESRPERLGELAANYPLSETYTDFGKVDLSRFDAAVICVPANLHIPFARRVVEAGAHVLIEKPLSINLDGVAELEQAVQEKGLTAGVAYVRRAMRMFQMVRDLLASGKIGQLRSAVFVVGADFRVARPDYQRIYFARRETGGGAVQDATSHMINLLQWLHGPVASVVASYDHLEIGSVDVEDTVSLLLRFRGNDTMANIHCNLWQAHREENLTLLGRDGSIVGRLWEEKLGLFSRKSGTWEWTDVPRGIPDARGQVDEPFVNEADNFLDAIEGKADVFCTLSEARHTTQVCMAALESGLEGWAVQIEP